MKMIPIARSYFDKNEPALVSGVIRSGWVAQGRMVKEFEAAVANFTGAEYAVAVSSGTTALHLALLISGVAAGDEVIVPSFSFIATANAVMYCGARPVFIDIDPGTYNIDPAEIENFLANGCRYDAGYKKLTNKTTGARIAAIMPVHQFGLPCDLDAINRIAKRYALAVVEDAACALGSSYKNRKIGDGRNVSCLSFHPRKIITTGEGGMILTNDRKFANKAMALRNHGACLQASGKGAAKETSVEDYDELGYNYRLTDMQAALGLGQMLKLKKILSERKRIAKAYDEAFRHAKAIETPYIPVYARTNYQSYVVKLNGNISDSRDAVVACMLESGVSTRRGNTAIHTRSFYRKRCGCVSLPATEEAALATIALPIYSGMSAREQEYVSGKMLSAISVSCG
jgi:dTDP-4-amino-4,6-dideoxygalactose transaminase